MYEGGPKFHTKAEELLAYWNKYPIILASQSDFRKTQLESLGFLNTAKSEPIPETVETSIAYDLNQSQGIPSYYANNGHDVVRHIAGAKVHYVLDHQTVDPEAIVLAFDTAPLIWQTNAQEDGYSFEHLEKPKTSAEGKNLIKRVIRITADGCKLREKRIADMQLEFASLPADIRDSTIKELTAVLDIGTISIVSAAAGSFPNNRLKVLGFSDKISLFSQAINVMKHDDYALDILSDKVVELMRGNSNQMSGGIDYTDIAIRDLLKISELKIDVMEDTITGTEHYLGLSYQSLLILLAHAKSETSIITEN